MLRKIKTWEELADVESEDYKVEVELLGGGGYAWIVPKEETEETKEDFFQHHRYLSTHTFNPSTCKISTELLQKFGFDVELMPDA